MSKLSVHLLLLLQCCLVTTRAQLKHTAGPGLEPAGVQVYSPGPAPAVVTAPAVLPALLPAPAPALEAAALQMRSGDAPGPGPAPKRERGVAPSPAKLQSRQPPESSDRAKPASGWQSADPRAAEARAPAWAFRAEFAFLGVAAAAIALFAVGVICCWTHCCASCCRLRVDPCGNPADLEAATPSDCPQRDTTCSVLDSEPCRVEIANASQASVQLIWYSYEGSAVAAGAVWPGEVYQLQTWKTQRWKLVDMASGAPLADIVADAGISLMHISADEGGRLQSEVVGRHVERACLGPPACASCQPCARSG